MKILILGANGFIGNALVKELCKKKSTTIYAMDLYTDKLGHSINKPNLSFVEGDININNEWIEYNIKKCDICHSFIDNDCDICNNYNRNNKIISSFNNPQPGYLKY